MLHHIVMWTLKDYAEGNRKKENALLMKAKFEKLMPAIEEIKKLEVGINMSSSQYANFDIVLDTWLKIIERWKYIKSTSCMQKYQAGQER